MMRRLSILVTVFLILTILSIFSQSQGQRTISRRLYIFIEGKTGISLKEEGLLRQTLILGITGSGPIVVIEAKQKQPVPEQDIDKTDFAAERGADVWLEVLASAERGTASIEARLFDIKSGAILFEKSFQSELNVSRLEEGFWNELVWDLIRYLEPASQQIVQGDIKGVEEIRVIEHPKGVEVTLEAIPGTRITGFGRELYIVDESGSLKLEAVPSATYCIEARHWKYYPDKKSLYLRREPETISFQQIPGSKLGLEFISNMHNDNGIGVLYYLLPNYFYANFRFVNSFFSIMPPFVNKDRDEWFTRNLEFSLSVGSYINSPLAVARFAFTAGGFVRFSFPEGHSPRLHPVFPYGWTAASIMEISTSPRFRFYLEWAPEIYFYIPYDSDPEGPYEHYNREPWENLTQLKGLGLAVRFGNVHLGLRYQF